MKRTIPALFVMLSATTMANPVDIENARHAARANFTSVLSASVSSLSDTYKSERMSLNAGLYWKNQLSSTAINLKHDWGTYDKNINTNKSSFYASNLYKLGDFSRHSAELFFGASQDKFREINYNLEAGLGYRIDIKNEFNKRVNAFAFGLNYEKSSEGEEQQDKHLWRTYGYWHHEQPITATVYARNTLSVKISLDDIDDYVIQNGLELINKIGKKTEIGVKLELAYDSKAYLKEFDSYRSTTVFIRTAF